eukprot:scaffold1487_cov130-Skeletonema_marinoi.AAC.2
MDADESFKSPELQRLEDEVKLMEAEMDAAHREFEHYQVDNNYSENNDSTLSPHDESVFVEANSVDCLTPHPQKRSSPTSVVHKESTAATNTNDYDQTPSSTRHTFSDALKRAAFLFASIPRGLGLAFVIFVFSVIAQMYPTAPQSGCYISLLLALFQVKSVSWQDQKDKGKTHIASLVAIVGITIIFDIDWLISNYFVESLGGENDAFEFKLTQRTSFVWQMAWWAEAINVFVKIISINDYLNVWSLLRGYFMSSKTDVSKSVSQKVILVTWVELLSSLILFVYFFLIQFDVVSGRMNVFNEAPVQILSVQATLLFKGTSGIVVFLSLVHHIKIRDLCGQCGCSYFCVVDSRESRRNRKKIVSSLKRSLNCITFAKAVDFVFGVMLWISLVNARSSILHDAPKDVKAVLILMIMTNSFTSLTPVLVGSIVWSIRLSEKHREESRQEAMDQNTPHRSSRRASRRDIRLTDRRSIASTDTTSAYDSYDFGNPNVRISQSLFSTRLDAASPTPTPSPSAPPLVQQQTHHHQYAPFDLDLNLYCTPQEFESEWQSLSRSSCSCKEEYSISNIATLAQCNMHFNQVGWSILASGVVDNVTKLFLIAQRKVQMPKKSPSGTTLQSSLRKTTPPRCLAQLSFGMNSKMILEMRSQHEDQIDFFIGSLELVDLFHAA